MKHTRWLPVLLAGAIALAAGPVLAQGHGSGGGAQQRPQMQQNQRDMQKQADQQKQQQQAQQQARQQASQPAQQQAQKQLRGPLADDDVYGREMMTAEERDRYRERLAAAGSDADWVRMRAEHQQEMQQRAMAQGRNLVPPVYGQQMMTAEERKQYAQRMQNASSDAERERIREEHRETITERARNLGIDPPPAD